jgi:hypothetical protein
MRERSPIVTRRFFGAVLVVAVAAAACGGRPAVGEWESRWREAAAVVPLDTLVADPPGRAECDRILGDVRELSPDLRPAPNDVIDDAVLAWSEFAEAAFFECPITGGEHAGWEAAALELARLESEVDALVVFEQGRSGD